MGRRSRRRPDKLYHGPANVSLLLGMANPDHAPFFFSPETTTGTAFVIVK